MEYQHQEQQEHQEEQDNQPQEFNESREFEPLEEKFSQLEEIDLGQAILDELTPKEPDLRNADPILLTPAERKLRHKQLVSKNLKTWKKGQSGNPNGRPPGKSKKSAALKWLELQEQSMNEITGQDEVLSQEDLMTLAIIKRAKKGDVKAYSELMKIAYGDDKNVNINGVIGIANITGMEIY